MDHPGVDGCLSPSPSTTDGATRDLDKDPPPDRGGPDLDRPHRATDAAGDLPATHGVFPSGDTVPSVVTGPPTAEWRRYPGTETMQDALAYQQTLQAREALQPSADLDLQLQKEFTSTHKSLDLDGHLWDHLDRIDGGRGGNAFGDRKAAKGAELRNKARIIERLDPSTIDAMMSLEFTGDAHHCEIYVDAIHALCQASRLQVGGVGLVTFRRILIGTCQDKFQEILRDIGMDCESTGQRRSAMATRRFIGRLFVRQLLTTAIIWQIIEDLLAGEPFEPRVGYVLELVATVGEHLGARDKVQLAVVLDRLDIPTARNSPPGYSRGLARSSHAEIGRSHVT